MHGLQRWMVSTVIHHQGLLSYFNSTYTLNGSNLDLTFRFLKDLKAIKKDQSVNKHFKIRGEESRMLQQFKTFLLPNRYLWMKRVQTEPWVLQTILKQPFYASFQERKGETRKRMTGPCKSKLVEESWAIAPLAGDVRKRLVRLSLIIATWTNWYVCGCHSLSRFFSHTVMKIKIYWIVSRSTYVWPFRATVNKI